MLSVQTIQIVGASLVTGGVLGFFGFMFYAKKKGINLDDGLKKASTIVNVAGAALDNISPLLPPTLANDLEYIEKWAKIAVGKADQLYHAGEIGKDDRNTTAQSVVESLLKELNITPTDSMKDLINAAIENAVNESGHADKTEAEKQAETDTLKANLAQVTQERDTLKNAITTAASSVQANTQTATTTGDQTTVTAAQ